MSSASNAFRDSAEFQRGRSGEKLVARWLQERGSYVIASYDYSGEDDDKAPRMEGFNNAFVVPDLDVSNMGNRYWVEVKVKACATEHRKTQTWEHGISLRLFRDYKRVERLSGCACFLAVVQEDNGKILWRKLGDESEGRVYEGAKMGRGGMIFWPLASFKEMGRPQ